MEMPVVYLDGGDFDINNSSLNIADAIDKPVIVFIMSESCMHCRNAKPAYQEFARKYDGKVVAAVVDVNDHRGREFLTKLGYQVTGVPDYLKFVHGRWVREKPTGRNLNALAQFAFNKNVV
jgi:thiol-disulfide isomerase/thioredoxin